MAEEYIDFSLSKGVPNLRVNTTNIPKVDEEQEEEITSGNYLDYSLGLTEDSAEKYTDFSLSQNVSKSSEVDNYLFVGEGGGTAINFPKYMAERQRDPKFLTGGIFGEAGTSGDVSEQFYKKTLTKEDILEDKVLMDVIRQGLSARYSDNLTSKLGGAVTAMAGGATGGVFDRDYYTQSNEKVFETWQNWMRSFSVGNSVTIANEVSAGIFATPQEKMRLGASYKIFDRMDNAFTGRGTYAEMGDALFDYTKGAILDPINLFTLGIGKFLFGAGAKASAEGAKIVMKNYFKDQLSKGISKEVAKKNITKALARRELVLSTAAFALPDMAFNIGLDILQQTQLVNVDNQEEIDKGRVGLSALMTMLVPAITGVSYGFKELRRSDKFKDSFIGYENIDKAFKEGANLKKLLDDRVNPNIPNLIEAVDETFGGIKGDPSKMKAWAEAKENSKKYLVEQFGKEALKSDTGHLNQFYRELLFGTIDEQGDVITKGYLQALNEAGFVFHPKMIEEMKITGVLGQSLEYIPDEIMEKAMKNYESRTGKSLNMNYTSKAAGSKFITEVSLAGGILQVPQQALRAINNQTKNMNAAVRAFAGVKKVEDTSPKRFEWSLGIYKRLLTSHPATTVSNLKGFNALTLLDAASEITSSITNMALYVPYKALGKNEKATFYANQAYGSLLGEARRGVSVLSPDLDMAYAKKILDLKPEVRERLFRDVAGDGGPNDSLAMFNLDKGGISSIGYKGVDAVTRGQQTLSLMRLQDEVTKLWAFGNNVNQRIMKVYGETPTKFYSRKDIGLEIHSEKFKTEVLDKATYRTMRQTASVNWSRLTKMHGNNFFRYGAVQFEKLTNKTPVGFVVPFGSFMNTVLATFGDYSGFNFLRFTAQKVRGKPLDPESQDYMESLVKAGVGWTYVMYRTFDGPNSAINKVEEGRAYNENKNEQGAMLDTTYDWPLNQFDMSAQIIAHGLSGKGKSLEQEIANLSPEEIPAYIIKNFNPKNVPSDLIKTAIDSLGAAALREPDKLSAYVNRQILGTYVPQAFEGRDGLELVVGAAEFGLNILGDAGARVLQGATRSLEPYDLAVNLFTNDGKIPDIRQGNKRLNSATKYVRNLLTLTPFEDVSSMKEERRAMFPEGFNLRPDIAKSLGLRYSDVKTVGERMLDSAGVLTWKWNRWEGDPKVKNAMDAIASPIFEQLAVDYLRDNPNFFNESLEKKMFVLNQMKNRFRKLTLDRLDSMTPPTLSLLKKVTSGGRDAYNFAVDILDIEELVGSTKIEDILERDDSVEILNNINTYMENYRSGDRLGMQ